MTVRWRMVKPVTCLSGPYPRYPLTLPSPARGEGFSEQAPYSLLPWRERVGGGGGKKRFTGNAGGDFQSSSTES